jgi:integrase
MKFSQFAAENFEPGILPTLKFSTQQIYALLLRKHLLPRFGNDCLSEINKMQIQRFVLDKLKQGLAWETVNHLRCLLSKIMGTAVEWHFVGENPVHGVKMPERTLKRPRGFLTADEVTRLLSCLEEPARAVVALGAATGLRIGELLGLRWGRVDLNRGTLRVEENCYKGKFGTPKTGASRREIPLAPAVVGILLARRARALSPSPDALVFCTRKGTALAADNLLKRHLAPACCRAGLERATWHSLRRTHGTLLQAQGTPLKYAQAQLGHSKMATTLEVYTLNVTEEQRQAQGKLAEVLFPNVPTMHRNATGENEEAPLTQ